MPKIPNRNNTAPQQNRDPVLARMQKRIAIQAGMALTAIVLTVVMIFAMTAAWYTNIVHTSGLTFEVEAWGFNGDITTEMLPIIAGPGDDGVIDLEVQSDSDSPSAVSVSFSKELMPELMKQRIYFYADTQVIRNNEIVDRVYLNNLESYTYSLFSQGKLTLTESVHNAAQLKWHWVYDVLGYYVQGVRMADGQDIFVTEYLRPIEYDYDEATMEYVTDKNGVTTMALTTVDGERTPEEFLVEFSKADGYEGTIDPQKKVEVSPGSFYYPVDVDGETGKGVYAYLCSWSEIQKNTDDDTALGQGDYSNAVPPFTAKLLVSAQKSKNTVISVNSLVGLMAAAELGAGDTIKLSDDVTIGTDEVWTIAAGQRIMLDLDGHRLVTTDPDTIPIVVEEGGSLTVVNGVLDYENEEKSSRNYAIHVTGAEVTMSNVTLTDYELGMKISDNTAPKSKDSAIRLVNCNWTTNDTSLLVYGNGSDTVQKTRIIIEGSTLTSNNITLCGNGSVGNATDGGNYGTDIQIIDSRIISNKDVPDGQSNVFGAIYQPQKDSVLTIYNSEISGYTGIAVKGGTVNIIGSSVTGWGLGMDEVNKFSNSGYNDTGDAVYIETNYNYPVELNISDLVTGFGENAVTIPATLTSVKQYALRVYDPKADCVKVNIVSGTFLTKNESKRPVPDKERFSKYLDENSEIIWGQAEHSCMVAQKTEQSGGGN